MTAKFCILLLTLTTLIHADVPDIDAETRARLGIVIEDLAPAELAPTIAATATVLDPSPLVALLRQANSAAETVNFSQIAADRAEKLFAAGNLVPQKTVDAARAQLLTDQAAHQTILDSITATYGNSSSSIKNPEKLLKSEKVLVRLSTRSTPESEPLSATIGSITSTSLTRAPSADPVFQNVSWLAEIDAKNLVPGMTLPATLTFKGRPQKGRLLPSSAIVWHLGHPWIFHETKAGKFERIAAQTTTPIPGGTLITDPEFPTTAIVTTGAQLLLSAEMEPERGL